MSPLDLFLILLYLLGPLVLLLVPMAGFVVGLGLWVLFRRKDPPLLLLVAVGLCGGAFGAWGPDPWSDIPEQSGAVWLLLSGIWSASVLVQPAGRDELRPAADRMRLLRWFLPTLAGAALASALLDSMDSGAFAAFLALPLLASACLSLYDTERVRRVRRSVAWLQLTAATACAVAYGPRLSWSLLAEQPLLPLLIVPLAWGLLAPLPVAVLWVLGPRERGWRWLAGLLVAAGLLGMGRTEWLTRTQRALLHLDLSDLPTRAFASGLPAGGPRCIETPSSRCPEGVEPLWVWPADAPIGDRLAGRSGALQFSVVEEGSSVLRFGADPITGPAVVRLGEGEYGAAGKRVGGLQAALSAIEEMQGVCGDRFTFEPDPDWTPQELLTLCQHDCNYEPSSDPCAWDEDLGWVTRCEPGELCLVVNGTLGICERGGCALWLQLRSNRLPPGPVRVSCDAGRCTVDGGGQAVELSCRGGGCIVSNATSATVLCDAGDCNVRP